VILRPGSTAWLMHHEFRLYWRGFSKDVATKISLLLLLVFLHLIAIPVALVGRRAPPLAPVTAALALTIGAGIVLLLMISRGLITAVQALYARGDMDLLLSSPVSPHTIIAVRATFIAASVTLEFAVLIWPFADVFVLFGQFVWLRAYVLVPALGLLATTISLLLALGLFYVFGARRTRVIAQVTSALIAVSFMLMLQLPNMLRPAGRGHTAVVSALSFGSGLKDTALLAPAVAVLGSPLFTLALAAACTALFAATVRRLGGAFIRASIAAASISVGRRSRQSSSALRFHGNPRLIFILKELRLIARDPWLLTQLFQQGIYLLPMGLVLWRQSSSSLPLAWGLVILLAGVLASALAWLTVSAEDVPELMAAAPISADQILRVKLEAALLPILPLILLPVIVLWRSHAWFGFSIAVCSLGSALTCALLSVSRYSPSKRRDFRMRNKGSPGRGIAELLVVSGWAAICTIMVWISPWR
jgi:ABC-2 type transport system permease protein